MKVKSAVKRAPKNVTGEIETFLERNEPLTENEQNPIRFQSHFLAMPVNTGVVLR